MVMPVIRPMLMLESGRPDGAISRDGQVMGCYMHGLFASDAYRSTWVRAATGQSSSLDFEAGVDDGLEALASHLESHADIDAIARIAGL